jgi:hypothetical protein
MSYWRGVGRLVASVRRGSRPGWARRIGTGLVRPVALELAWFGAACRLGVVWFGLSHWLDWVRVGLSHWQGRDGAVRRGQSHRDGRAWEGSSRWLGWDRIVAEWLVALY